MHVGGVTPQQRVDSPLPHELAGVRCVVTALGLEDLRALGWLQATPELSKTVGSLGIAVSDDQDATLEPMALCDVLALCSNIDSLSLKCPLDLERFVAQLLLQHPCGLPKLRNLQFAHGGTLESRYLLQLLQVLPNLQRIDRMPLAPDAIPVLRANVASFVGPIRSHYLEVRAENGGLVFPLLASRRWIARTVHFALTPRLLNVLENHDGPASDSVDIVDLTLNAWAGKQRPGLASLISWVARACRALRRLRVMSYNEHMLLLLSPLLKTGAFRLRELTLHFVISNPAVGDQAVMRLAALLLSVPPALATLRILRITLTAPPTRPYGHLLHDVRVLCRARRIVYSLIGPSSDYAVPGTVFPRPVSTDAPPKRRCCFVL